MWWLKSWCRSWVNFLETCDTSHPRNPILVIQAAAEAVAAIHGHLDMLLNVSGLLHTTDGIAPGQTLRLLVTYHTTKIPSCHCLVYWTKERLLYFFCKLLTSTNGDILFGSSFSLNLKGVESWSNDNRCWNTPKSHEFCQLTRTASYDTQCNCKDTSKSCTQYLQAGL